MDSWGECVTRECRCPRCKRSRTLVRLPANFKCADVICDFCGYLAQVKAVTVRIGGQPPEAGFGSSMGTATGTHGSRDLLPTVPCLSQRRGSRDLLSGPRTRVGQAGAVLKSTARMI